MSYATPSAMLARYDARVLGDLVNDTGTRQTPTQLLTDPNLQAALDDAAGLIDMACLVSERYTVAELNALTGTDAAILFRLNCDLAFYYLALRRGVPLNDLQKQQTEMALDLLEKLKQGERLFNVAANVADGVPASQFPSMTAYSTINLLRDAAHRAFPVRRYQQPASS